VRRAAAGMLACATDWARWLAEHQVLCLILFFSFVARLFLADWKSYWYDEILSVAIYGSNHATLAAAMKSLAAQSAHPPLYHAILYYWMQMFGTAEVATRTLSNLYITGATLCLYVLALRLFGRRVAIASALLFAFSYTATYFGLEVRSYAQSLFLVTLSSLLLWRWLDQADQVPAARHFFFAGAALLLCNIALLLTHYSNALFVIVQLLFAGFFFVYRGPAGTRSRTLLKVAGFYATQFAVALAIWGPVVVSTQKRFAAQAGYAVQGLPEHMPPAIFLESVIRPTFDLPRVVTVAVGICLALVLLGRAKRYFFRAKAAPPLNQHFLFYLAAWAIVPSVIAYFFYLVAGWERYVPRYFAICVPPFVILLVLALEQFVELIGVAWRKAQAAVRRHYLRNALLYALVACAIFALPGAYEAAKDPKGIYRDLARSIVRLIEQDPKSSFAIVEAARRRQSLLNYYLARFSKAKPLQVDATLRTSGERPGRDPLKRIETKIAGRDFLIVAFPFDSVSKFPVLMSSLEDRYTLAFSQLSRRGRGYVVFKLRARAATDPAH